MSKSRDIADSAATINFIDGLTSDVQEQLNTLDPLPSQTGNSGKYLATDGTDASWAEIPSSDRYSSTIISSNTTLVSDTHYFTGSGTTINDGVTLTIPANTLLEVKLYAAGKAL